MLGEDPTRIFISRSPRTVKGLMAFTQDRLEDLLKTLMDMDFTEDVDRVMFLHLPDTDQKVHLAERCLEGLRAADQYYKNKGRM